MKIKKIIVTIMSIIVIISCVFTSNTVEASSSGSSSSLVPKECIGAGSVSIYQWRNEKNSTFTKYSGILKISVSSSNGSSSSNSSSFSPISNAHGSSHKTFKINIQSNNSNYRGSGDGTAILYQDGTMIEAYTITKKYKNGSTETVNASYTNGKGHIIANFVGIDGCSATYDNNSTPSLVICNNSNGTNCIGNGATSSSSGSGGSSNSTSNSTTSSGTWKQDSKGWWYQNADGSYPASTWKQIDGKWYYFLSDGYMDYSEYRDGCWLNADGSWNTTYSHGTWKSDSKGWWYEDNGWYPVNQSLWIDGTQYYFDASGYLYTEYNNSNGDYWTKYGNKYGY